LVVQLFFFFFSLYTFGDIHLNPVRPYRFCMAVKHHFADILKPANTAIRVHRTIKEIETAFCFYRMFKLFSCFFDVVFVYAFFPIFVIRCDAMRPGS